MNRSIGKHQYVDIHTHQSGGQGNVWSLRSLRYQELGDVGREKDACYSVGIHPWDIEGLTNPELAVREIQSSLQQPSVIAVGEVGLDKNISTSMDQQSSMLERHIKLAEIN